MNKFRAYLTVIVTILWISIGVVIFIRKYEPEPLISSTPQIPISEIGKKYQIKRIVVIRGDTFDLTIKDDSESRILAKLPVIAVDNAKVKVLDILNHCTQPQVALRDKQPDGHWLVDLSFSSDGKEVNLAEWLIANKLVFK